MADQKPKTKLGQAITTGEKTNLSSMQGQGLAGGKGKSTTTTTFAAQLDKRLQSLFASRPTPSPDLPKQEPTKLTPGKSSGKTLASPQGKGLKGGVAK